MKRIKRPVPFLLAYIQAHCKYDPLTGVITCDVNHKIRSIGKSPDRARVFRISVYLPEYEKTVRFDYQYHHVAWFLHYGEWPPNGKVIDHDDGNPSNNRIANLRIATFGQNMHNRRKGTTKTASKYKGVHSSGKKQNPWRASIKHEDTFISIGNFATEEDAARAYDKRALELFGEFACLNFGANNALDRLEWRKEVEGSKDKK